MTDSKQPSIEKKLRSLISDPDYRPMRQHELARALMANKNERRDLRNTLKKMEQAGTIVCLRKNRWALPIKGKLHSGTISIHHRGFGFITSDDKDSTQDAFVPSSGIGNALHGDRVQYTVKSTPSRSKEDSTEARVVKILERRMNSLVGLLKKNRNQWFIVPDSNRVSQDIHVRDGGSDIQLVKDHKVVVRLDEEPQSSTEMTGVVIEDLGHWEEPGIEILSLLRDYQLDENFPDAVEREAAAFNDDPSPEDLGGRLDLREEMLFTIDPDDARDFDDAVSLTKDFSGNYRLGVHIADVSHFVQPGTQLEKEAYLRATSVYMADRVVSMLPKSLTNIACSLRPNVERLAHSVFITLDSKLEPIKTESGQSMIRSRARMTYAQVQAFFNESKDHGVPENVIPMLQEMRGLARAVRKKRIQNGALDFNLPEVKCRLNDEGDIEGFDVRESNESYQLIEEFMLLANQAVARKLSQAGIPTMYRIHEPPDDEDWGKISMGLTTLGMEATPTDQQDLNALARACKGKPYEYIANLTILRNMKRAVYSAEHKEHFGLAFLDYTHFTSPIRRYPDLVVHRILNAIERGVKTPYAHEEIAAMAYHCSTMERNANDAENESIEIKRMEYYKSQLDKGETGPFEAVVVAMKTKGMVVELRETLQKGMVPFAFLTDDHYEADTARGTVKGRRSKRAWTIGDQVEVTLARVDTTNRFIDFQLTGQPKQPQRKKSGVRRAHPGKTLKRRTKRGKRK